MKRLIAFYLFCLLGLNTALAVDHKISPADLKISPNAPAKFFGEYPMDFSANVKVNSDTLRMQIWSDIAYDPVQKVVHAIWWDYGSGSCSIYYARSTDEGQTWATNERVDDSNSAMYPSITLDNNGRPAVAWADGRNGGGDIYVSIREDKGWTKSVMINDDREHKASMPDIFFKNGKFYAAWTDGRDDGIFTDIYTSISINGKKWTKNIRANDNLGYDPVASDPEIQIGDDGVFYLVFNGWEGNVPGGRYPDAYFTKSTDAGQTWMSPQVRMNILDLWFQQDPHLAVDEQGWLYAVWEDDAEDFWDFNIRFARSTDNGLHWINKIIDDDPNVGNRMYPKIIFNNGYLNAIWGYDCRNGCQDIYFTLSKNQGEDWSSNQKVNNDEYNYVNGGVQIAGNEQGDVYCSWHEYHANNLISYEILSSKGTLKPTGIEFKNPNDKIATNFLRIFPNPISQTATISYSLAQAADVRLTIYDLNGRLVKILLDKKQNAGQQNLIYRQDNLPQGVYFLEVRINNHQTREKFIILK